MSSRNGANPFLSFTVSCVWDLLCSSTMGTFSVILYRISLLLLCTGLSWQEQQRPSSISSSSSPPNSVGDDEESSCPSPDVASPTPAPHDHRGGYLRTMTYDVGLGNEQSFVYIDLTEGEDDGDGRRLCKFYNLSPIPLHLIRKDDDTGTFELIQVLDPVTAAGVTCEVGSHYIWLDRSNPRLPTHEVWIQEDDDTRHYVYEQPIEMIDDDINAQQRDQYIQFQRGLKYDQFYRQATGRSYLGSSYPPRPPPRHTFWPTDYMGQEHLVEMDGKNQSLLVYSISPRILVMGDFLSTIELDLIQALAADKGYSDSDTLSAADRRLQRRTSETCWLSRKAYPVLQRIYRRAGQLLRIPNMTDCCAEDLQVVQYSEGQEYRAHFDFKLPSTGNAPVRFATLLVYLTDCPKGGETIFPLAAGGALGFKPTAGAAMLFYSLLPDGNVDERSLHASNPVQEGQKRISNIWVWDPHVDLSTMD